ncbi:MAG: hypothetical protein IJT22_04670 [Synergistaceae bacterium]|nr:hypothetical protein [Synergistaceae bacterium]
MSSIAPPAVQAAHMQYLPPASLALCAASARFLAFSLPKNALPLSDSANAISPSTLVTSSFNSLINALAASFSLGVPNALIKLFQASLASAQQDGASISSWTFLITSSLLMLIIKPPVRI